MNLDNLSAPGNSDILVSFGLHIPTLWCYIYSQRRESFSFSGARQSRANQWESDNSLAPLFIFNVLLRLEGTTVQKKMEIETKEMSVHKIAECKQMQTSTYPNKFLYGFMFGILATILLIGGYYAVKDLQPISQPITDNRPEVWEERNDYNGEKTDCFWVIDKERNKVSYVAYENEEEQAILTSFPYKIVSVNEFKKYNPSVKFYLDQRERELYNLPNSANLLIGGPIENETETWGYPVYIIMLPYNNKTYAFINSPDGEKTYLSYAVLTKLSKDDPIVSNIKYEK